MALAGTAGALVEVNAETDFVARNESFQELVRRIAALAPAAKGDLEALKAARIEATGRTVDEEITQAIAVIGENINLRRTAYLEVAQGAVAGYLHNQLSPGPRQARRAGGAGVGRRCRRAWPRLGKQLAMHVAATNPQAVSADQLDPAVVERERAIFADQARASGKPENIIEKMVEGRRAQVLRGGGAARAGLRGRHRQAGEGGGPGRRQGSSAPPIEVVAFVRMALGEGVEKGGGDDFAAEVAQLAGV